MRFRLIARAGIGLLEVGRCVEGISQRSEGCCRRVAGVGRRGDAACVGNTLLIHAPFWDRSAGLGRLRRNANRERNPFMFASFRRLFGLVLCLRPDWVFQGDG